MIAAGAPTPSAFWWWASCRQPHNAPLHLFSASSELLGYARSAYRRHSEHTSGLFYQLFEKLRGEGFAVAYTMEDFTRQFVKDHFSQLTPEEREEVLRSLPTEQRLAGLSTQQIRQYLNRRATGRPAAPRKPRRKK
jgi:hypothetical protein